jgi:hypothetical protein
VFSVKYENLAETFFKCISEREYCEVRAEAEETVEHPSYNAT